MYSRYSEHQPFIPMNNRLRREERGNHREDRREERREDRREERREERREDRRGGLLPALFGERGIAGKKPGFLSGFLKNLDFDSDDILLILIILFLSKDSDDEELLIILGLMLFMGL